MYEGTSTNKGEGPLAGAVGSRWMEGVKPELMKCSRRAALSDRARVIRISIMRQ